MRVLVENVLKAEEDYKGDLVYRLEDIVRAATETIVLVDRRDAPEAVLAVLQDDGDSLLSFGVFEFACSEISGADAKYSCVFHGYGYTEYLRELRHTHWGDKGYLFYPSHDTIVKALGELKRWFDF